MKRYYGAALVAACVAAAACGEVGQINSVAPSSVAADTGTGAGARLSTQSMTDDSKPSCPTGGPDGLRVSTHGSGVDVSWDVIANVIDYQVDVRKDGVSLPGFPVMEDKTSRSLAIKDSGSYDARVRPRSCGDYMGNWAVVRFSMDGPRKPAYVPPPVVETPPNVENPPNDPGNGNSDPVIDPPPIDDGGSVGGDDPGDDSNQPGDDDNGGWTGGDNHGGNGGNHGGNDGGNHNGDNDGNHGGNNGGNHGGNNGGNHGGNNGGNNNGNHGGNNGGDHGGNNGGNHGGNDDDHNGGDHNDGDHNEGNHGGNNYDN